MSLHEITARFGRTRRWNVSDESASGVGDRGSWGPQDDSDSVAALNRALDLGVNFIDTRRATATARASA
jgi:aryl-alcohol dehydrogenase-like predicted oxidoreductase